jgi:hypothetical protein
MVHDLAPSEYHLIVGRGDSEVGETLGERSFAGTELGNRFNEAIGKIAAGCGENGAGTDGWVTHTQVEDLVRTA